MRSPTAGFDTAKFQGALADYTFTVDGVTVTAAQLAGVSTESIITVTDIADATINGDGTDSLRHIERLRGSGALDLAKVEEARRPRTAR